MTVTDRIPHAQGERLARALIEVLSPACERIEIAGSIRRGAPTVKDVELVVTPRVRRDLTGAVLDDALRPVVIDLVRAGRLSWRLREDGQTIARGPRFYALVASKAGISVDLFAVIEPAQWGAIMAIRTGPAEYSQALVTRARERGLRCVDGHLEWISSGAVMPTPEERDFIEACGFEYVSPEQRRG